jgi:hypothetical protein
MGAISSSTRPLETVVAALREDPIAAPLEPHDSVPFSPHLRPDRHLFSVSREFNELVERLLIVFSTTFQCFLMNTSLFPAIEAVRITGRHFRETRSVVGSMATRPLCGVSCEFYKLVGRFAVVLPTRAQLFLKAFAAVPLVDVISDGPMRPSEGTQSPIKGLHPVSTGVARPITSFSPRLVGRDTLDWVRFICVSTV